MRWFGFSDIGIWAAVLFFFLYFAFRSGGEISIALLASLGVILIMTAIGFSIEIIIEVLRNKRGLGTILGFLTNGPEMVVLLAGIIAGDVLFGVSTPLGSTAINAIMLVLAAIVTGTAIKLLQAKKIVYGLLCIIITVILASIFYFLPEELYLWWIITALLITISFFLLRPKEKKRKDRPSEVPSWIILPALLLLLLSGSFLDPMVEFAGEVSGVPKNLIGFLALGTLSSWPELKSCITLFKKGFIEAAGINIFVSNITNIWLAIIGISLYLL